MSPVTQICHFYCPGGLLLLFRDSDRDLETITTENLAELAQNWVETSREAGTKFTFQFSLSSIGYLQKLSTEITQLTGIPARNDEDQLWFSFEMRNEKELMIYREYGPHGKPTCIDRTVDWTLAMEIL